MSAILVEQDKHVLKVGINRTEKKNSLTLDMYEQMAIALEGAEESNCRAVLIYGEGEDFCAGNDISVFAQSDSSMQAKEAKRFMQALMHCPLPTVAKVKGNAIGIGTTMLLHCDFAYASDSSVFWMPFVDLALVPEFASSFLLPQIAGSKKAAQWLMLGDKFGINEAQQYGVITQGVESSKLDSYVDKALTRLVSKPINALKSTKSLLNYQRSNTESHMEAEFEIFFKQLVSEEAKQAFAAFLSKGKG